MARIIGIDFGTTHSKISVGDLGQAMPIIIPNLDGKPTTPSVVGLVDSEIVVGQTAKRLLPPQVFFETKRQMSLDLGETIGGKTYTPRVIAAFILSYLKRSAEKFLGEPVHDAVIAVPAYFGEPERDAIREAGSIAGFNVRELVDESAAAMVGYTLNSSDRQRRRKFAVLDLGGTLKASILDIEGESVTVLSHSGDHGLGGLRVDEEIAQWVIRKAAERYGTHIELDRFDELRLRVEAEAAKEVLASSPTAMIDLSLLADRNRASMDRLVLAQHEFRHLTRPVEEGTMACLKAAVHQAEDHSGRGVG